jgi:hypothetical protein
MSGVIPPFPNTSPWRCAQLKHRDNFTFTLPSHEYKGNQTTPLPRIEPRPSSPYSVSDGALINIVVAVHVRKYHVMKTYCSNRSTAPRILNLDTKWK